MTTEIIPFTTEASWLKERQADITSTESAALFGLSPYVTAFELYHRKKSGEVPEFKTNDRMSWGNRLEAAIAHGIAEEQGWDIRPMKEYMRVPGERTGSSFDFIITNHPSGEPAHLEIKNVDYLAFRDGWLMHDDGVIEAPTHIEMQVQHQMLVSGFPRSFIGALIGGNKGIVIERERDEAVIASIRHRIAKFWQDVVDSNEPAPLMPEDAAAVIALNQYAKPGKILDASSDAEITTIVAQYKLASTQEAKAKEDKEVLKAQFLERIGDAEKVLLTGFTVSASMVADTPPSVITADMVGTTHGGRKGYRNFRVTTKKEMK
jgi:putative phage-type endonuclease